jgi:tetratricopeptide (TPR) repeat protein
MRTFGELLTEFMRRTGTSDSELARTLDVRRQTIFRWKEGLVERPRRRDDILSIAQKLRLTPEERDELLLAAGFAPETSAPMIAVEPPTVSPIPPAPESAEIIPAVSPVSDSSIRAIRAIRGLTISVRVLVILFIVAFLTVTLIVTLALWQSNTNVAYPTAVPGQSLVIVAPLVGSASSVSAETPIRRLPDTTPIATNINDRIRAALDRELLAARLDDAHVELWTQEIRDANSANDALRRSNAKIIIWGKYENGNILARLAIAPATSRADDLPLDSLVAVPTDMEIKIDGASTEAIRTLALIAVSQLHIERGDFDLAHATLTQASANQPVFWAFSGYVSQVSKPPDLVSAIQAYSQTIDLAPDSNIVYLNRGVAYIRQNNPQWQTDFARAFANNSDDTRIRLAYCWALALDRQPQQALSHCDAAINRDNSGRLNDARAIVYAQLGRTQDATNDLQRFLDWLAKQSPTLQARYGASRTEWLQSLKAGQNTFDQATLDRLRRE